MTQHHRPALDVLADLRRGRLAAELTSELHDLIGVCIDTGKKGSIVLTLTVDPKKTADFETPQIQVTDQINAKKPRRSTMPSTFFLTDDGAPVRRDPNQDSFESLRAVEPTAETTSTTDRKAN